MFFQFEKAIPDRVLAIFATLYNIFKFADAKLFGICPEDLFPAFNANSALSERQFRFIGLPFRVSGTLQL